MWIGTTLNWSGTKPVENEKLKSSWRGIDKTPFKVLRKEVEILDGPQALLELSDIIILSISVELVGDKKKIEACGLSRQQLNGRFGLGTADAKFFPILEKNLFKCTPIALSFVISCSLIINLLLLFLPCWSWNILYNNWFYLV